ncbi:MAG: hypothetical protein ACK5YR_14475 [Pirellula sp.]|jgi:hypothetical protein
MRQRSACESRLQSALDWGRPVFEGKRTQTLDFVSKSLGEPMDVIMAASVLLEIKLL